MPVRARFCGSRCRLAAPRVLALPRLRSSAPVALRPLAFRVELLLACPMFHVKHSLRFPQLLECAAFVGQAAFAAFRVPLLLLFGFRLLALERSTEELAAGVHVGDFE